MRCNLSVICHIFIYSFILFLVLRFSSGQIPWGQMAQEKCGLFIAAHPVLSAAVHVGQCSALLVGTGEEEVNGLEWQSYGLRRKSDSYPGNIGRMPRSLRSIGCVLDDSANVWTWCWCLIVYEGKSWLRDVVNVDKCNMILSNITFEYLWIRSYQIHQGTDAIALFNKNINLVDFFLY